MNKLEDFLTKLTMGGMTLSSIHEIKKGIIATDVHYEIHAEQSIGKVNTYSIYNLFALPKQNNYGFAQIVTE